MHPSLIPKLSSLLWEYYDEGELIDIAQLFGVSFPLASPFESPSLRTKQDFLAFSRRLAEDIDQGNTRALIETLLEQLDLRNSTAIAKTGWERRQAHEALSPLIGEWRDALAKEAVPSEIAVPAKKPFAAKSEVREFLEQATTPVFVVDPYVGVGTLDCLRLVSTPIRLLTANRPDAIEPGFPAGLVDFNNEGRTIDVRRGTMLHDRHLAFNGRCWLVGSSLKDAGKKAFNCTEIIDSKSVVLADLEAKWTAATPFP